MGLLESIIVNGKLQKRANERTNVIGHEPYGDIVGIETNADRIAVDRSKLYSVNPALLMTWNA